MSAVADTIVSLVERADNLEQRVAELERIVAELRSAKDRSAAGYVGVPPVGVSWRRKAEFPLAEATWELYEGETRPGPWTDFKLVAAAGARVPHKANYVLCWNGNRFALSKQSQLLEEHRPELYRAVMELLKGQEQ